MCVQHTTARVCWLQEETVAARQALAAAESAAAESQAAAAAAQAAADAAAAQMEARARRAALLDDEGRLEVRGTAPAGPAQVERATSHPCVPSQFSHCRTRLVACHDDSWAHITARVYMCVSSAHPCLIRPPHGTPPFTPAGGRARRLQPARRRHGSRRRLGAGCLAAQPARQRQRPAPSRRRQPQRQHRNPGQPHPTRGPLPRRRHRRRRRGGRRRQGRRRQRRQQRRRWAAHLDSGGSRWRRR